MEFGFFDKTAYNASYTWQHMVGVKQKQSSQSRSAVGGGWVLFMCTAIMCNYEHLLLFLWWHMLDQAAY